MSGVRASGAVAWEIDMSSPAAAPSPPREAATKSPATTAQRSGPYSSCLSAPSASGTESPSVRRPAPGRTGNVHRIDAGGSSGRAAGTPPSASALPRVAGVAQSTRSGGSLSGGRGGSRAAPPPVQALSRAAGSRRAEPTPGSRNSNRLPSTKPLSSSSSPGAIVPAGGRALSGCQSRPGAVARALHEREGGAPVTAKGRAILEDMQDLADDHFGGVESRAPPAESGGQVPFSASSLSSSLARDKILFTEAVVPLRWRSGPSDTQGRMFDASDSNLLCMDVLPAAPHASAARRGGSGGALCVVGSADHGLKVFDLATVREVRTLFSKTSGHTDWVTTCRFFPDGRVLSGGMDSKLCLWDSVLTGGGRAAARCQDLLGHTASISQVELNGDKGRAVSASYDRTLRVWDCGGGWAREVGLLAGHKAPVTQFDWCGVQVLSGDRQGQAKVWDLERATCLATIATKRGQIGAVQQVCHDVAGELTMLGDQGGVLTVVDLRQGKRPIWQGEAHPGGVLSGIRGVYTSGRAGRDGGDAQGPYIVSCGADRRLCVHDPRMSFAAVHTFTDHQDFIYSMETFGSLVVSGGGNGWVLVHDTRTGECCYGLGAGRNAIREVFAAPQCLVAAGDDGKAVVYDF